MSDSDSKHDPSKAPQGIRIDHLGRMVDSEGNVIDMKIGPVSTMKINQKKEQERRVKQMLKLQRDTFGGSKREGKFYDPALEEAKRKRERKKLGAFSFVEQGTYIKRGEMIRKKQTLELLDSADPALIPAAGGTTAGTQATSALSRILSKGSKFRPPDPVPEVEWWDAALLPPDKKSFAPKRGGDAAENGVARAAAPTLKEFSEADFAISETDLLTKLITNLVQHPPPVKNEYMERLNNTAVKVMLTDKERKKLARNKRLEKEKDKREKIKLGLMPPPQPKIKMGNYMQILTKEAVADPSKTEAEVKRIIEERQMQHLRHNLERKLTPQQKHEKRKRKLNKDLNEECRTALFRVETLANPSHRFKVDVNAQEHLLTGMCIIPDKAYAKSIPCLVVIEGGPWAIKKYKKLMLRRMKWTAPPEGVSEEDKARIAEEVKDNKAALVWEGVVKKRIFDRWRVMDVRSDTEARRLLADKAVVRFEATNNFIIGSLLEHGDKLQVWR